MVGASGNEIDILVTLQNKASADLAALRTQLDAMGGSGNKLSGIFSTLGSIGTRVFGDLQIAGKSLAVGLGIATVAFGVLGKKALEGAADFETQRVAFENMLGSAEKAKTLLKQVSDFAAKTPFQLPEVVQGAKELLAYGASAEDIIPKLTLVGDAASKMGVPIQQAIDVWAKAKAGMFEIREFAPLGVTREALSQYGVEFKKTGEVVDRSMLLPALEKMWGSQGTVGMMAKQSQTLKGITSNLLDDLGRVTRGILGISDEGDITKGSIFDRLKNAAASFLAWLDAHRESITNFFQNMVTKISTISAQVVSVLTPIVRTVQNFYNSLSDQNKKALIIGLFTAIGAALIAFVAPFLVAFAEIMAVMVAIQLIVAVLYKAWTSNFLGIRDITMAVWSGMVNFYNQYLVPLFVEIQKRLSTHSAFWTSVWNNIVIELKIIWALIKGVAEIGWALVSGIIKVGIDIFTGNWSKAWTDVKNIFKGIWDAIKTMWNGIWDSMSSSVTSAISSMTSKISSLINKIKDLVNSAKDLGGKIAKSIGFSVGGIVPGFANGGVVYAANGFIPSGTDTVPAMLTPGEMVLNGQQQSNLFKQLNGAGGSGVNHFNFNFAGAVITDKNGLVKMITDQINRKNELRKLGSTT